MRREEDGEIVGFSDYKKETNELSGLYVKPDYTGKGIGEKLLQKAEKDAKENGLERLWCKSTITAKGFYQKHGYEVLEETIHEIEGVEMKVFRMEKEL
ncbi:GNAT family N-acetyltransferase [Candidatus Nanohalococcus occultus]|uniref:GNAT family N-acetyltransferase n=1 Tax=Candidatus Nanohalococcus occultus TaxID=2978047 RepID=UPI0039E1DCA5